MRALTISRVRTSSSRSLRSGLARGCTVSQPAYPLKEVLELATQIQARAAEKTASVTWLLMIIAATLGTIGAVIGWLLSSGIARPIQRIVAGLGEGARQADDAAGQVSSASQQLAAGASEQASSLEETSSARRRCPP